jgi:predicted dehydrogenase
LGFERGGVGTHLIDLWRWYFEEPASVGGGLLSPVHHSVNDELATLVLLYPDRLLAELAVTAWLADKTHQLKSMSYPSDIEQPLPGRNLIYLAYFLSKELENLSS